MKIDFKKFEKENKKLYSQHHQDNFVLFYFNNKKNGIFVDFGANDGIINSNTYYLEQQLNWSGLCIEPIPYVYKDLEKNRKCIKINKGISDKENIEKFTVLSTYKYQLSGIKKEYDKERHEKIIKQAQDLHENIEEIDISCITLNSLLETYNMFYIDYMSIDTEGNELKILKSIDFNKFYIELLTVENNVKNNDQIDFMISMNYNYIGRLRNDDVFSKNK